MTRSFGFVAAAGLLVMAATGAWLTSWSSAPAPSPAPAARPALKLLTSLPLVFAEGFRIDGNGSPVLARLEQRYAVEPISVTDGASLGSARLLLMAHPRAQPAEALVALDQWVRGGGHLLLLADPRLDWPSERPLGDQLRPPPAFADTGLLAHWGLTLAGPPLAGPETIGRLTDTGTDIGTGTGTGTGVCAIIDQGAVARCRIGQGRATIIADADFLNVEASDAAGLDLLMAELARLETR